MVPLGYNIDSLSMVIRVSPDGWQSLWNLLPHWIELGELASSSKFFSSRYTTKRITLLHTGAHAKVNTQSGVAPPLNNQLVQHIIYMDLFSGMIQELCFLCAWLQWDVAKDTHSDSNIKCI